MALLDSRKFSTLKKSVRLIEKPITLHKIQEIFAKLVFEKNKSKNTINHKVTLEFQKGQYAKAGIIRDLIYFMTFCLNTFVSTNSELTCLGLPSSFDHNLLRILIYYEQK